MKLIKDIAILLLNAVFLLTATGFYYVKHTCNCNGTSQILWSDKYNCHKGSSIQSCCLSLPEQNESLDLGGHDGSNPRVNCCKNRLNYVKDGSSYNRPVNLSESFLKTTYLMLNAAAGDYSWKSPSAWRRIVLTPFQDNLPGRLYLVNLTLII